MNWTDIILFVILGFTIYRIAKHLEQRLDGLEEKVSENDALCDEWMGYIQLWGMVWQSKVAGYVLGIKGAADGKDMNEWDDSDKKKQNELWSRLGEKLSIGLHYHPTLNSWSVEVENKTHFLSRRMTGYRANQCLYKIDLIERKGETLAVAIYERTVRDKESKKNDKRLAFCVMHYKGLSLEGEKDQAFIIAEYPLPDSTQHWVRRPQETAEEYDVHRKSLGWELQEQGVRDPYKDYFGEYDLAEWPGTYSNKGVSVIPWIGEI